MEIRVVTSKDTAEDISRLYEIMIHAYQVTEIEIWGEKYKRMLPEEFNAIIAREELIGVWVEGIAVGSIHVYPLKADTFAFGLFSVDFAFKGRNIGRRLIDAAESKAISEGAEYMELEILRLKNKELTSKKRLKDWYERLGYQHISTTDFVDRKPDKAEKAKNFIAPSVFDCYRKTLK